MTTWRFPVTARPCLARGQGRASVASASGPTGGRDWLTGPASPRSMFHSISCHDGQSVSGLLELNTKDTQSFCHVECNRKAGLVLWFTSFKSGELFLVISVSRASWGWFIFYFLIMLCPFSGWTTGHSCVWGTAHVSQCAWTRVSPGCTWTFIKLHYAKVRLAMTGRCKVQFRCLQPVCSPAMAAAHTSTVTKSDNWSQYMSM